MLFRSNDLMWFGLFALVLIIYNLFYLKKTIIIAFDPEFAKVHNLPVRMIENIMMIFIAIAIVLTIRLIGLVLLMSVITIPQMVSGIFFNDYKKIMYLSILVCLVTCVGGLFASFYMNVPAGACIVFIQVAAYAICKVVSYLRNRQRKQMQ